MGRKPKNKEVSTETIEKPKRKYVKKKNILNNPEIVEKKSETTDKTVTETVKSDNVEVNPVNNVVNQGISPEIEEQVDNKQKEQVEELDINLPLDTKTIFIINRGALFCEGDFFNPHNGTKIQRTSETTFVMVGTDDKGKPFGQPITAEKEWCDWLYAQLVDYNNNPSKYTIETAPLPSEMNQNPNIQPPIQHSTDPQNSQPVNPSTTINPIITQQSIKPESFTEPEKDFTGIPLTKHNIHDLVNQMPNVVNEDTTPKTKFNMGEAFNIDAIVQNQSLENMNEYGKSIMDNINGSFQARMWGGLPFNEAQALLNISSKDYTYELVNDGKGVFLKMKKENIEIRVPKNVNEYLKVK